MTPEFDASTDGDAFVIVAACTDNGKANGPHLGYAVIDVAYADREIIGQATDGKYQYLCPEQPDS